MAKFPLITVYHPTEKGSVPFSNIAWPGFVGSLTGYSSAGIGISERLFKFVLCLDWEMSITKIQHYLENHGLML